MVGDEHRATTSPVNISDDESDNESLSEPQIILAEEEKLSTLSLSFVNDETYLSGSAILERVAVGVVCLL